MKQNDNGREKEIGKERMWTCVEGDTKQIVSSSFERKFLKWDFVNMDWCPIVIKTFK